MGWDLPKKFKESDQLASADCEILEKLLDKNQDTRFGYTHNKNNALACLETEEYFKHGNEQIENRKPPLQDIAKSVVNKNKKVSTMVNALKLFDSKSVEAADTDSEDEEYFANMHLYEPEHYDKSKANTFEIPPGKKVKKKKLIKYLISLIVKLELKIY